MVTHDRTNQALGRTISLIETNVLPLSHWTVIQMLHTHTHTHAHTHTYIYIYIRCTNSNCKAADCMCQFSRFNCQADAY